MLPVTVKSYCIGKTCIQSISESRLECSTLTLIDFQFYDYRFHRHCIQKAHCIIRASIAYDNDIIALPQGT